MNDVEVLIPVREDGCSPSFTVCTLLILSLLLHSCLNNKVKKGTNNEIY